MEIWDPFTGNIHHTTDKLPQQGSQTTAFFFQIVSMNANTELLFVGGTFSSLPIISDVWKFRYSSGVWTNVGKLHYPIREHTSFLVYNLSCTWWSRWVIKEKLIHIAEEGKLFCTFIFIFWKPLKPNQKDIIGGNLFYLKKLNFFVKLWYIDWFISFKFISIDCYPSENMLIEFLRNGHWKYTLKFERLFLSTTFHCK